jgi:2-(1,2-epoxy-1,2-dihydrophenyl)acetyl-CoA isomerase
VNTLILEREGGVLWLRLNRPHARNGIDEGLRGEFAAALAAADRDREVRAIVITGTGPDFCVGADLASSAGTEPENPLDYRIPMQPYQDLFRQLWELETPVVSAVRGRVAGIGWLLALLADLVVASDSAKWTHVFTRRGMVPHAGDPFFLPRILPFHVLNEIALLGDTITSGDLHRWGAVNRVVADGFVDKTAGELAARLAAGPTLSLGQARRLYRRSLVSDMATAFAEEGAAAAMLSATSDRAEGMAALMEGRRPDFTGRLSERIVPNGWLCLPRRQVPARVTSTQAPLHAPPRLEQPLPSGHRLFVGAQRDHRLGHVQGLTVAEILGVPQRADGRLDSQRRQGGDGGGRLLRGGVQAVSGDDLLDEADLVRPPGAHPLGGAEQRHAHDLADRHPLEHHHGLEHRGKAVGRVRVEEGGVLGRDDELNLTEQVEGATAGHPVDRGDHRLPQLARGLRRQQVDRIVRVHRGPADLPEVGIPARFTDRRIGAVEPGAERLVPGASENHDPDVVVFAQLPPAGVNLMHHLPVKGVEHLGPVERDPGDAVALGVFQRLVSRHAPVLPAPMVLSWPSHAMRALICRRTSLPVSVRGSCGTTCTRSGVLLPRSRPRTRSRSASGSTVQPGAGTTAASIR